MKTPISYVICQRSTANISTWIQKAWLEVQHALTALLAGFCLSSTWLTCPVTWHSVLSLSVMQSWAAMHWLSALSHHLPVAFLAFKAFTNGATCLPRVHFNFLQTSHSPLVMHLLKLLIQWHSITFSLIMYLLKPLIQWHSMSMKRKFLFLGKLSRRSCNNLIK